MCVKESKSPVPTSMEILSNKNLISPTNKFNKLNIEVYFNNQKRSGLTTVWRWWTNINNSRWKPNGCALVWVLKMIRIALKTMKKSQIHGFIRTFPCIFSMKMLIIGSKSWSRWVWKNPPPNDHLLLPKCKGVLHKAAAEIWTGPTTPHFKWL